MSILPKGLENLINALTKLPGVGPKTAGRFALDMLKWSQIELDELAETTKNLLSGINYCPNCHTMTESGLCAICQDKNRDNSVIAVVQKPLDVIALETSGDYKGVYHVLGGVIAPIEGSNPEDIKIKELIEKIKKGNVKEIILATNADLEGETTAMYIAKQIKEYGVKITRIARGLPAGGELEYADEITITSALAGRRDYGS